MQRSSSGTGDHLMPPSATMATTPDPNAYPRSAGLAPGQIFAPAAAARGWPTLPELFNALKRRLVLATFLGLLVGVGAAAAVWLALPNGKHRVRALLQISTGGATKQGGPRPSEGDFESFKQTQQTLIRGRMLLQRVIASPGVAKLNDVRSSDDPIRYLEENIKVVWPSPELMEVVMTGDDQVQLKAIMEALVLEYVKDAEGAEVRDRNRTRARLETMLSTTEKNIEQREANLERLIKQKIGPTPEMNALYMKMFSEILAKLVGDINTLELTAKTLELDLKRADARLAAIDAAPVDQEAIDAEVGKTPEYQEVYKELMQAENTLAEMIRKYTPNNPSVLAGREKVKEMRDGLRRMTAEARPRFEKAARTTMRADAAQKRGDLADATTSNTNSLATFRERQKAVEEQVSRLNTGGYKAITEFADLKPLREQRDKLKSELLDLEIWDKVEPRIQKREDPNVVLNQNLKQKVLLSIAALVAGTTVIMLAVAFLEWRSRRVDSVDQVVNELGLRVIGTIPAFPTKQALRSGDASTSQNWRFVLNESVNSARTMLLHTAKTQNMQVLMVTSAMQGEGKTSLASQLATSMATAGLRTLILDCDLRNPSMHKLFDAPLTPGCSEVLCQEIDVSDAVQPTAVPNLWLIPAGQCSNRVISALAQGHPLETLFNRLRGQFDFIVVDSCPVLPVADSLLVGQHVDGVLISILQDISQLPKVQQVSDKLTELNIPVLGAVVNGIKPDIHAYGYNYVKQLPA